MLLLSSVLPDHLVPVRIAFQELELKELQQQMVVPVKAAVWLFLGDYTESLNLKKKQNVRNLAHRAICAQDNFEVAGVLEACLGATACVAAFQLVSVECPHVEAIELTPEAVAVVKFSGCGDESVHPEVEGVTSSFCSCGSLGGASSLPSAGTPLVTAPGWGLSAWGTWPFAPDLEEPPRPPLVTRPAPPRPPRPPLAPRESPLPEVEGFGV